VVTQRGQRECTHPQAVEENDVIGH